MRDRPTARLQAPGFTLPAVMIVAVAMLILAIGLLSIIGIERKTARSFADAKRAELAARAGLEDFRAVLRTETANDDFLVIGGTPDRVPEDDLEVPPHLFIARGSGGGENVDYRYLPLFSTTELPPDFKQLRAPEIETADTGDDEFTSIAGPPWLDKPRVAWIPIEDGKGEVVARYAYWVEDLQAKLDAKTAGNVDGNDSAHARTPYPFPAAGLNPEPLADDEPKLDRVAIHVLDPDATEEGDGNLVRRVIDGRPVMISPESILAATGEEAPIEREDNGLLSDPVAAALERSASPVIEHYDERPTVPFAAGISADAAGKPKLNLNELLGQSRDSAVSEFAGWIDTALPDFEQRKGGFPEDYLQTLAANAFDYADRDNDPTVRQGSYRGLDGYPLVSEYMLSLTWDDVSRQDGRTFVTVIVELFSEFWNMTDQPVEGAVQLSYETQYTMALGAIPDIDLGDASLLSDPDVTVTNFVKEGDAYWSPSQTISLLPNEYRVVKMGEARFKFDAGPASLFVPSPLEVMNDDQLTSGYQLRWNGEVVDFARGKQRRYDQLLYYPGNNSTNSSQKVSATIPGHSYKLKTEAYINNMGDPRMSMYLDAPQDANSWPQNYSPNRRTIRWGSIYSSDSAAKRRHYGRVLPAEWPDGGHNSAYGSNSFFTTDRRTRPDDKRFFNGLPTPVREQAPLRLSNLGRFYSATELGRTYDPIMWYPTYGNLDGSPGSGGRDTGTLNSSNPTLPTSRTSWPDVELTSPLSTSNGGGNTLRIGRAEHPRFEQAGLHAAHMLDIFHAGEGTSDEAKLREGDLVSIAGNVNLNTAGADALRALAAGMLVQDPLLSQTTSTNHQTSSLMAQPTFPLKLGTPARAKIADRVAEAIIRSRPFASAADLASARDDGDEPVFGNKEMYSQKTRIEWTDSAAEEVFARIYDSSTLRSRNFRIWVIGQAVAPARRGSGGKLEVLSESKKVFTVFADPGERDEDGMIDPATYRPRVIHENDF